MAYRVKAMIHDYKGRTLLAKKRKSKRWSLFGGHTENKYESDEACLKRELREEEGIERIFQIEHLFRNSSAVVYIVRCELPKRLSARGEIDKARLFKYPKKCRLNPLARKALDEYEKWVERRNQMTSYF